MRATMLRTAAIAKLVVAAIPSPAGAQKAVGLALEVVGPVRPTLLAFTEIRTEGHVADAIELQDVASKGTAGGRSRFTRTYGLRWLG